MQILKRWICLVLAVSLAVLPLSPASAALIDNARIVQQVRADLDRQDVLEVLDREDARRQLEAMGVAPDQVKERVKHMTDQEVAQLNAHLAEMPAGGDALGIILVLFIVFVITDLLGATDIFPFVHPIK
jgi:hypothetical protein